MELRPVFGNLLAQEVERDGGELGACGVAFVVGDVLVHEAPEPLAGG